VQRTEQFQKKKITLPSLGENPLTPHPWALVPRQSDFGVAPLYSPGPLKETPMAQAKAETPAIVPFARYSPAEVARNKKARDVRRKSIRAQNASSRMK